MPTDDVTLCFEQETFHAIVAALCAAVRVESEKDGCPSGWMRVRLDLAAARVLFSALVVQLEARLTADDA